MNPQRSQLSHRHLLLFPPLVAPRQLELSTPVCLSRIPPPLASPPGSAWPLLSPELVSACARPVTASVAKPESMYLSFLKPRCQIFCFAIAFPLVAAKEGETEGEGGRKRSIFLFGVLSIANTFSAPPSFTSGGYEPFLHYISYIYIIHIYVYTHTVWMLGSHPPCQTLFCGACATGQEHTSIGARGKGVHALGGPSRTQPG